MQKQLLTSLLTLLIALPGLSLAGGRDHDGRYDRFMTFFDANKDGVVSQAEFAQSSAERFRKMDVDANGTISPDEFSQYLQERRRQRKQEKFAKLDANTDGVVSLEEYLAFNRARAEQRFRALDKDTDGFVSAKDFAESRRGNRKHAGKRIFSRLDGNNDGQISQEESQAAWLQWFTRLDINGDQTVTVDEIREAHANRRASR